MSKQYLFHPSFSSTTELINNNGESKKTQPSTEVPKEEEDTMFMSYKTRYITTIILFVVNLLNYMDRYTIAGVLLDVQDYYKIGDFDSGLLQIIFVVGFMLTSPIFGYCGDRYNRKWLMVGGIALWSAVTLASSFVPSNMFWLLILLRGIVGIGEASYCTIAPTIISDMFVKSRRSAMLMLFFFAIPVGSGLGYIVGSYVAQLAGSWQWALRVTPGLGLICCLLIAIISKDPPRGMAEHGVSHESQYTFKQDMLALLKHKTFIFSTAGNTCVTFISGALALFAPKFLTYAYRAQGNNTIPNEQVSLYMGIITTGAGFAGVALGTFAAKLVKRKHKNGDPLVCAFGLIMSTPFLFFALVLSQYNMNITWPLILIGEILVFMNWSLVADMLLYTVPATRRSTAEAMQIFISHLFGDAFSPTLLGKVSDTLRGDDLTKFQAYKSLQYSLYITLFVGVLGGGFFLFGSLFIVKDKAEAEATTKGVTVAQTDTAAEAKQELEMKEANNH